MTIYIHDENIIIIHRNWFLQMFGKILQTKNAMVNHNNIKWIKCIIYSAKFSISKYYYFYYKNLSLHVDFDIIASYNHIIYKDIIWLPFKASFLLLISADRSCTNLIPKYAVRVCYSSFHLHLFIITSNRT